MSGSIFSSGKGNKDAVMHTLERVAIEPKNINLKANLNEEQQSAEVEMLFVDKYFYDNWGIDVGWKGIVKDFNETSLSVMGEYHRPTQAVDVMRAQEFEQKNEGASDVIGKLLGK